MTQIIIMNGETWLICGGRDFTDQEMFDNAMNDLLSVWGLPNKIVHGCATGADAMADRWGNRYALEVIRVPPDWGRLGKFAGPDRNKRMLTKHKPDRVIAFPGGKGTSNMVSLAHKARAKRPELTVVEVVKKRGWDAWRPSHKLDWPTYNSISI